MYERKHLVYAEDLVYEIMQYPSKTISKRLVRNCAEELIKNHEVSVWEHIWYSIKMRFKKWFVKK